MRFSYWERLAQNPGLTLSAVPALTRTSAQNALSFHIPNISSLSADTDVTAARRALLSAFQNEPAPPTYSLRTNPAAQITDPARQQKITAVLMKAGITNPAAWAAAGLSSSVVATSVSTSSGAAAATATEQFDLHPATVLMKGTHDSTFLISWHSQRDVVSSLNWKSTLMIWGGPALTLLCVYILAAHFD